MIARNEQGDCAQDSLANAYGSSLGSTLPKSQM
jgi:hypothetical protein